MCRKIPLYVLIVLSILIVSPQTAYCSISDNQAETSDIETPLIEIEPVIEIIDSEETEDILQDMGVSDNEIYETLVQEDNSHVTDLVVTDLEDDRSNIEILNDIFTLICVVAVLLALLNGLVLGFGVIWWVSKW